MNKIKIKNKTIKSTTKCHQNFACLENPDIVCEVENCIQDGVCFIKHDESTNCNYKFPFGDSYFCTCPIRIEIYNKYRM